MLKIIFKTIKIVLQPILTYFPQVEIPFFPYFRLALELFLFFDILNGKLLHFFNDAFKLP